MALPKYRLLCIGERVLHTDEWKSRDNRWNQWGESFLHKDYLVTTNTRPIRRKLNILEAVLIKAKNQQLTK